MQCVCIPKVTIEEEELVRLKFSALTSSSISSDIIWGAKTVTIGLVERLTNFSLELTLKRLVLELPFEPKTNFKLYKLNFSYYYVAYITIIFSS